MAGSEPFTVCRDGAALVVRHGDRDRLRLHAEPGPCWRLAVAEASPDGPRLDAAVAALEAILAADAAIDAVVLDGEGWVPLRAELLRRGIAVASDGGLAVLPELFWQQPAPWLAQPGHPFPPSPAMTDGRRHPRRAPKPVGEVYVRYIPWLDEVLSLRTLDIDADLERFHRWMNDPRVARFWKEDGDLAHHRRYLDRLHGDPHMLTLIGCFDGTPFGYFEIYWAKENRLGPYYDADDYDRGWHVVVGEDAYRGRPRLSAWLPSLMHYLFLDDCRTRRIVGEPQADHHQQIRNLERSGFASVKTFDFPHKRARLVMLLRERFFCDRLWVPGGGEGAAQHA